ncbi:MAG TPA: universal stress protein [Arthrobacter sp.]|nr:universal stress protein [Arthrobacter sp.]
MKAIEVLAGADASSQGRRAADWAAQRADGLGLRLHLVRVVPESWYYRTPAQYAEAVARAQTLLVQERGRLTARHPGLQVITGWQPGEPAPVLSRLSDGAEMVVLGSDRSSDRRGEGSGSVGFQAAVLCRCPVAVIPARTAADRSGVVAGIDGSEDSVVALQLAAAEAQRIGEVLTILHAASAVPPGGPVPSGEPDALSLIAGAARSIRESHPGLTVHETLEPNGSPAEVLIRSALQASLLVIGCRGRGGLRKPIGSIAEKVLSGLPCPTIVTRPASGQAS